MTGAGCAVEEFQKQAGFLLAQAEGQHSSPRQAWLMPLGLCEHTENMLQGTQNVAALWLYEVFSIPPLLHWQCESLSQHPPLQHAETPTSLWE